MLPHLDCQELCCAALQIRIVHMPTPFAQTDAHTCTHDPALCKTHLALEALGGPLANTAGHLVTWHHLLLLQPNQEQGHPFDVGCCRKKNAGNDLADKSLVMYPGLSASTQRGNMFSGRQPLYVSHRCDSHMDFTGQRTHICIYIYTYMY